MERKGVILALFSARFPLPPEATSQVSLFIVTPPPHASYPAPLAGRAHAGSSGYQWAPARSQYLVPPAPPETSLVSRRALWRRESPGIPTLLAAISHPGDGWRDVDAREIDQVDTMAMQMSSGSVSGATSPPGGPSQASASHSEHPLKIMTTVCRKSGCVFAGSGSAKRWVITSTPAASAEAAPKSCAHAPASRGSA